MSQSKRVGGAREGGGGVAVDPHLLLAGETWFPQLCPQSGRGILPLRITEVFRGYIRYVVLHSSGEGPERSCSIREMNKWIDRWGAKI